MDVNFPEINNVLQNQANWASYYFNLFVDLAIDVFSLVFGVIVILWIIKMVMRTLYGIFR